MTLLHCAMRQALCFECITHTPYPKVLPDLISLEHELAGDRCHYKDRDAEEGWRWGCPGTCISAHVMPFELLIDIHPWAHHTAPAKHEQFAYGITKFLSLATESKLLALGSRTITGAKVLRLPCSVPKHS